MRHERRAGHDPMAVPLEKFEKRRANVLRGHCLYCTSPFSCRGSREDAEAGEAETIPARFASCRLLVLVLLSASCALSPARAQQLQDALRLEALAGQIPEQTLELGVVGDIGAAAE